ncbi:hypothetical protein [Nonomuraea typhae]|uniref:hypothetical protein n=1 Tax=Nonomuraea typhae TaxID=2603600 RepID=UPI0012F72B49|nr:hypothetical protein [Nonomuraea typhae]
MIQITLGKKKLVDPGDDRLGRSQVGWEEGLSGDQLYVTARGAWVMGKKADHERYALISGAGVIRGGIEIDGIEPAGERRAFVGRLLQPGHPVYDHYVGQEAPNGSPQNPITYFPTSLDERVCACRCGTPITRGDFLPGHDQRAIHERIAKVGTVKDFLAWFDDTWADA